MNDLPTRVALLLCAGLLALGCFTTLGGSSKTEEALRRELAQTRAALDAATQKNAREIKQHTKTLADLTGQTSDASDAANANAAEAQAAVIAARRQSEKLLRVSEHSDFASYTTLITTVGGFLTLIATLLWQGYSQARAHRWEVEATQLHRKLELGRICQVQQTVNRRLADVPLAAANSAQRVLVVDDDPEVFPLLRLALNRCGVITFDSALDGAAALGALAENSYTLLILDLTLTAGPSGMDVLRAAEAAAVTTVVLTADGSAEAFVRSLNTGAVDVLIKPFQVEELVTRLSVLFASLEMNKC